MSKPRYRWYTIAQRVLRDYPDLYRRRAELREQRVTAGYSGAPGGSGDPRKTEATVLKQLGSRDEEELEAVLQTINTASKWPNGEETLRMVEMVDWKRTHTVRGAEIALELGDSAGRDLRRKFIYELAKNLGYN
jgi:hypothetical protein